MGRRMDTVLDFAASCRILRSKVWGILSPLELKLDRKRNPTCYYPFVPIMQKLDSMLASGVMEKSVGLDQLIGKEERW